MKIIIKNHYNQEILTTDEKKYKTDIKKMYDDGKLSLAWSISFELMTQEDENLQEGYTRDGHRLIIGKKNVPAEFNCSLPEEYASNSNSEYVHNKIIDLLDDTINPLFYGKPRKTYCYHERKI